MKTCPATNKARFTSQDAAISGAVRLMARRKDAGHRPLNVYRCDKCGDWHVGHRPCVMVASRAPVESAPIAEGPRCDCACTKLAVESVETAHGTMRCCAHHAKRVARVCVGAHAD